MSTNLSKQLFQNEKTSNENHFLKIVYNLSKRPKILKFAT